MIEKQRTLKDSVHLKGVGLHTGELVNVEIIPAKYGYHVISIGLQNMVINMMIPTFKKSTLDIEIKRLRLTIFTKNFNDTLLQFI